MVRHGGVRRLQPQRTQRSPVPKGITALHLFRRVGTELDPHPYQKSPEAVRDVHRFLKLMKKERCEFLSESDLKSMESTRQTIGQLDGAEVVEIFLNNGPLFARALAK